MHPLLFQDAGCRDFEMSCTSGFMFQMHHCKFTQVQPIAEVHSVKVQLQGVINVMGCDRNAEGTLQSKRCKGGVGDCSV